jgi:NhaC family Na+:H+ antiporter
MERKEVDFEKEKAKKAQKEKTNFVGEAIRPSLGISILAFMSVVVTLVVGGLVLGTVSVHACLILSVVFVCVIGKFGVGYNFATMMDFMAKSLTKAAFGLWFFVAIGAIIGTWMLSGTVPGIIYYGLGIITPKLFLPLGLILCSVTALSTGSSWATIGTVGVALMGIGESLGMPLPMTAAMIISGASFGDKMSPISDIPNLAAMGAGADIYESIKAMFITMTPAYLISLVLFTILGFKNGGGEANMQIAIQTREVLAANFNLSPIIFLPLLVLLILNIKKVPALPTMAIAVATAMAIAVIFQGASIDTALECINSGFHRNTGSEFVDGILNRGGLQSMLWSFSIGFLALSLGGLLDRAGFLSVMIENVVAKAKTVGQLTLLVMFTSFLSAAAFAETYMPIIMNGTVYKREFDKRGLSRSMLARITSEGVLMFAPLMIWNAFGAFAAGALGITPDQYIQYAYLNLLSPVVSVAMSYLGLGVMWNNKKNKGVRKFKDVDLSDEPVYLEA